MKVVGLSMLWGKAIGKVMGLGVFCDTVPRFNPNLCAKYLSATVELYADP